MCARPGDSLTGLVSRQGNCYYTSFMGSWETTTEVRSLSSTRDGSALRWRRRSSRAPRTSTFFARNAGVALFAVVTATSACKKSPNDLVETAKLGGGGLKRMRVGSPIQVAPSFYWKTEEKVSFFGRETTVERDKKIQGVTYTAWVAGSVADVEVRGPSMTVRCKQPGTGALEVQVRGGSGVFLWDVACHPAIPPDLVEPWSKCALPSDWNDMTEAQRKSVARDARKRLRKKPVRLFGRVDDVTQGYDGMKLILVPDASEEEEGFGFGGVHQKAEVAVPRKLRDKVMEVRKGDELVVAGKYTWEGCGIGAFMVVGWATQNIRLESLESFADYLMAKREQ